jgi:phosphopantetheinyl transferase
MPMLLPPLPTLSLLTNALSAQLPHHAATLSLSGLIDPEEYLQAPPSSSAKTDALNALELAKLASFKLPKRRRQWFTGRLCVKNAIMNYCRQYLPHLRPPAAGSLHIQNLPSGRPALLCDIPELQGLDISVSHSEEYAIACAASGLCGIDIQKESEKVVRVRDRFCHDSEVQILQQYLPDLDRCQQLTLLWTAKEAAKKALSQDKMPEFLALTLVRCILLQDGLYIFSLQQTERISTAASPYLSVLTTPFDDYAISLTLIDSEDMYA